MKKTVLLPILLICLLFAQGCAFAQAPTADRAGNPIKFPAEIKTIVSLAPSITQVLIDIQVADRIVGVDTYSKEFEGLPAGIPAFDMMAPDMEQLISLSPDVVLVSGMMFVDGEDKLDQLTALGICVVNIPSSNSIEGILADCQFIGDLVGKGELVQSLNDALTSAIDSLPPPPAEPKKVYFEISPVPYLYSFGSGTFLNEMIELLGGINIFADQESWLSVSEEAVIAANPDIIFTNLSFDENAVGEILSRAGWQTVTAIENKAVYLIDADASSQPNYRIIHALTEMARAFAP